MAQPNDPFKQGLNSGALVQSSNVPNPTQPTQPTQPNSIAPTPSIGSNAQEIASNIFAIGQSKQDFNKYAKISAYDAGPSGTNRDRYLAFGRDTFEKLGFVPGIDNEAIYNEGTTTWDNTWRMLKEVAPLYFEGVKAPIMSYLDAGGGDFGQDIRAAANYEKASNIGYSTKGGLMPFLGNTAMSFAYTAGIMTEAVAEAFLLKKISPGLFTQAGKIAEGAAMQETFLKTTTNWLKDIKNVDAARSFFSRTAKGAGNFLNPVNHSWKNFNSTILNNADNLTNLARAQRTFGAFYLDARMINAALSEGRLEGGFVENEMMNQFYKDHYYRTGKTPNEKEMLAYKQQAEKAGMMDTMLNTALVFYSNKIAFPNLMKFGSFKIADDLAVPGGKLSRGKKGLEFIKDGFGNALKSLYNPKQLGKGAINYFKGNLMEGLQEVMQEALAESTKNHYTESFYHPNLATYRHAFGSFADGIESQLDSQGLETFGSGFIMGFGNKFLNAGIGKLSDLKEVYDSKLSYGEYMDGKAKDGEAIKDRINGSLNSVDKFFGDRFFDYGNQSLASKTINSKDADLKDQVDAKDAAFLSGVITSLNTGTFDMFIDKLNDIKQMKPEEIEDTNVLNLQPGEGQKALDRIDKIIAKAEKVQKRFNYITEKHKNPININNYGVGTKEREDAELYSKAWEATKFNVIFLNQSFDENLERINELGEAFQFITNQSTAQNPIYQTDVTTLYDRGNLSVEIDTLTNEISALTGVEDPKLQAEKTSKENKLARLQKYKEAQDKYIFFKQQVEQIRKFGKDITEGSEEEKAIIESKDADLLEVLSKNKREYKEALVDYLQDLTGSETEYFKLLRNFEDDGKGGVDDLFAKLVDIDELDNENKLMLQYINMLGDPNSFRDQVDRNYKWMKTMYLNKRDMIDKSVDEAMKSKEYQALLNTLSDKGIFIDLDEFAKWTKNNNYLPESFIDTTKEMVIPKGSELYDEYYSNFILAANASKVTDEDEEKSLRKKVNALAKERDQKIAAATEKYNNVLKDTTGFTESELLAKIEEYNQEFGNKIRELEEQIANLTNLKAAIKDVDSVAKVNEASELWNNALEAGILDKVEFQGLLSQVETDEEVLAKSIASITEVYNSIKGISQDLARQFGFIRYASSIMLDKKIDSLNAQKPNEENPYPDPKETLAYKEYTKELDLIEKDFKAKEKDVKEANKEFKDFDNNIKKTQITALSDWGDIQNEQPELAALLEEEFKTYLNRIANYEEYDVPAIRQDWLKTQGKVISDYMNTKVGASSKLAELRAEVPILKTSAQKIELDGELLSLDQMTLKQLKGIRTRFEDKLAKGEKLTAADKNNLKSDITAIQGYIEFRRTQKPLEKYQEQTEILKERLFDKQEQIEKTPEGYVIDKGTANEQFPQRATQLVNEIEKEITPEKPDFLAKSLYQTDTLLAINAFVTPESDVLPTNEARVNIFIETAKQLIKRGKFYEFKTEKKLESVRQGLTDLLNNQEDESVVSVGDVLAVLADIAYNQASSVGTSTDAMIRDFLEFKTPELPEGMTENSSAYKALFGPRGVITELRDSALDGENTFIANYVKVFDKELGPLDENDKPRGLAGEMDILMVNNTTGELMILDIKTGKKDNWDYFNIDEEIATKKSTLDNLKQQREDAEDPAKQKELDKKIEKAETEYAKVEGKFSKKLNYSIQQTIYRNLFYRMTGVLPTRIALLPIEVDYTLDGAIKSAKLATQVVDTDAKGNKKAVLDLQPVDLVNKYVPIGEVVPTITPTQGTVGEKLTETDVTSPMMQDNLSKPFMYKGQQGKLIFTEDGKYALETATEIIEISKQGKAQVAPESSLFDLGLTPISIIDSIGELITVDNKVYRVTNLNLDTDTVTINGVDYEIQRTPKKKQVNGVAYMNNQAAIRAIDEKIVTLSEELAQRRQAQPEEETINDYVRTNATKTFELDQLTKDRTRLVVGNKRRVITGSNVNDIVFVINKALALQNFKANSIEERVADLDELKMLFGSEKTYNELVMLFLEPPAALSKIFEQDIDAVTPEELARINDWASSTFMLLERQALVNPDPAFQNALSFLSDLINNVKLVQLNKDGQVSPKTETSEAQPGAPQSIVPKSGSEQPENVPGSEAGQTGTGEEIDSESIKEINKQVLGPIQTQRSENLVGYAKVKDDFAKATQNNVDFVYFAYIKDAIAGNLNVSAEAVETLYKERKAALTTQEIVSDKDIVKGDILISQIPIFTEESEEMFTVTKVNEKTGKVTVKNLDNKKTKTYTSEEIQQNFTRGSMESKPIAKEEIIIAEETKKLAEETSADIKTFVENAAAVQEVTDTFNNLNTEEEEDNLLADAARNCNI